MTNQSLAFAASAHTDLDKACRAVQDALGVTDSATLNFFEHVTLAAHFQRRDGEIDSALLAEEFADRWKKVFGDWNTDQHRMDALNSFISHVCRAATWQVEREEAARDDALLTPAREAAPDSHLVHLVTVTEASGDEWRTVITAHGLADAYTVANEACVAARRDIRDRCGRTVFSSGEIEIRFDNGQRVFIGVGL